MPRVKLCSNPKHRWTRKGARDICDVCGTSFPCVGKKCGHLDCTDAREIGIEQWDKENT